MRPEVEMKAALPMPRPQVVSADIAPVIQTPAHSAFPSGHATEAFCVATMLGLLFPARRAALRALAVRVAVNRSYAGVHYPVDDQAGAIFGDMLAGVFAKRLFGAQIVQTSPVDFAAAAVQPMPAVVGAGLEDYATSGLVLLPGAWPAPTRPARAPAVLAWLADEVLTELGR